VRLLASIRRARGVAALGAAALLLAVTPGAYAESSDDAQQTVDQLLARVHAIQAKVKAAEAAYDRTLSGVAHAVTVSTLTERAEERVAAQAAAAQQALADRVRGLYMSGGPMTVYASLLTTGDISDFQQSSMLVRSVMSANTDIVRSNDDVVDTVAARAHAAAHVTARRIATARDVAKVADRVTRLLAQQESLLAQAQSRVAHLQALEDARAAAAAQAAALTTITTARLSNLSILPASPAYMQLYHSAAPTCPGLSWTVLAAIGQVESGHGRNPSTSYAGAMGPMQFLPSTFQSYAVDGDHDGVADIMNSADAIFTAAHYLCANGAGRGPDALYKAIWHYNHADWYVQMVLTLAQRYAD
jgi:peptidoglycan hydrolase CwlO-like protein